MEGRSRLLLCAWVAILAATGWMVNERLTVGSDLRLFMPSPQSPEQRLILEEIGEGPASRMLLLAISGADPSQLAATSRALAARISGDREFRHVFNGEGDLDAIPEGMLAYRYLLTSTFDNQPLDTGFLHSQLVERSRDLASPAAGFLESWLPRDPTLEALAVAQAWQPLVQPTTVDGVWFDPSGASALLVAETRAAGFDPAGQKRASTALLRAFDEASTNPNVRLEVTGPGAFSVLMQGRTEREVQWIGSLDTLGLIALLLVAYRSASLVVLGVLPIASAAVMGLAAVSALFGEVHGITLAFGFTLIGVAQDYPIHLFSHQRAGSNALASARSLWPTLATGVASTCIAYLAFLFSGVRGLEQLSVFTVTGLAVAGLSTRYLLPRLLPPIQRDPADVAVLSRLWHAIAGLPRPAWLGVVLTISCVTIVSCSGRPLWEDDLGGLTPVPRALLERDAALRQAIGAPDVRYILAIEARDAQEALERSAAIEPALRTLVDGGDIRAFDHPARYLPPAAIQSNRQRALPTTPDLRAYLDAALAGTPFRSDAFEPFIEDVATARDLEPLRLEQLKGTPLESRLKSLLLKRPDHWTAIVTLTGVRNPVALEFLANNSPGASLLDLKQASEDLVQHQRDRILWCLAVSAILLLVVVSLALRSIGRVRRVLAPMLLTTILIVAILHMLGISLSLFHLIALILAAGLGLDYALFFEHAADDDAEQRRTLHAVIVCSLSTLLVFATLSFSSLPVLRAIGITVAIGVVANFFLALLLTRPAGSRSGR